MSDYVPYEERARQERSKQEASAKASAAHRAQEVAALRAAIRRLDGKTADYYVEVLRPHKGRLFGRSPAVVERQGERYMVSEVLKAFLVANAMHYTNKEDSKRPFIDHAVIGTDERLWSVSRSVTAVNGHTYMLKAHEARRIDDLNPDNLHRIMQSLCAR